MARKPTGPATQFPPLVSDAGPEATIIRRLHHQPTSRFTNETLRPFLVAPPARVPRPGGWEGARALAGGAGVLSVIAFGHNSLLEELWTGLLATIL